MGNFRIIIEAVGGHGIDRKVKDGGTVNFTIEPNSPDALAKGLVDSLVAQGVQVNVAMLNHWPGSENAVTDNLLTGKRVGQFEEANGND